MNIISENKQVNEKPLISIGVLTIPERKAQFSTLKKLILKAIKGHESEVEFLTVHSPKGTPKIGAKRNAFVDACKGKYCVMVDDDDLIDGDYFDIVLPVLREKEPDAIGCVIGCEFYTDGRLENKCTAITSNVYTGLGGNVKHPIHSITQGIYYKTPIRASLAKLIRFKNVSFAEDQDFSLRLKPFLRNTVFIDKVLYYYIYNRMSGQTRAQRYGDNTLKG